MGFVGPQVGEELAIDGVIALIFVIVGIKLEDLMKPVKSKDEVIVP